MRFGKGSWLLAGLILTGPAIAAPQAIVSPVNRVHLMELYTSEGCDSCPPAEEWLGSLVGDDRLWKQLVPMAFHVDYWDDLGWKDPFDDHAYTRRQQAISAHAGKPTVYTPEFVLDGTEWQNWFNHRPLDIPDPAKAGILNLIVEGNRHVSVTFIPAIPVSGGLQVNVVLLAFGVEVQVGAGENRGATLRHDFLVVSNVQGGLVFHKDSYDGKLVLPPPVSTSGVRYALAGWVSRPGDPTPLQAAGGWLKTPP